MSHNFHIGQDVVCIKTHSEGIVKKGSVYVIKGLKLGCCTIFVDVGIKAPNLNGSGTFEVNCFKCKKITYCHTDNTHWIGASLFAPLDTLTDISEIEEILNQPIEELFKVK